MARTVGIYILRMVLLIKVLGATSYEEDGELRFVKAEWDGSKYVHIEKARNEPGTEDVTSKWPPGPYVLPKSVDGCPESERKGWEQGYMDFTWQQPHAVFSKVESVNEANNLKETIDITQTKLPGIQSLLLGPYSRYRIKLNFCFKKRRNETLDIGTWSNGGYSIYGDNSGCPNGFTIDTIRIRLGKVSYFSYDGQLPKFRLDRNGTVEDHLELSVCSRVEHSGLKQNPTVVTSGGPFILLTFQSNSQSLHCPLMRNTIVTEETLYLQLNEASNVTQLLRFCYFQSTTWYLNRTAKMHDPFTMPEGIFGVRVHATVGQLSTKNFQQRNKESNYGSSEVLLSYVSPSAQATWKLLDIGRTVSVFGTYLAGHIDENSEQLHCYYSERKWDFLHFGASRCSFDVKYLYYWNNIYHLLLMKRIIEARYLAFISSSREMAATVLDKEVEFILLTTSYSYMTDESARCNIDLGMTDHSIENFQISASSSLPGFPAANARPFLSSWCASVNDTFPYILVDLYHIMKVEGMTVWNRDQVIETITNDTLYKNILQFGARRFAIYYGDSEDNLTSYNNQVFNLNALYAVEEPETFVFSSPFNARYVKIHVQEPLAHNLSCLRFELHGCRKTSIKNLQCKTSRTLTRVPPLINLSKKPLKEFYNLSLNECYNKCIANTNCSIVESMPDIKCVHYESNQDKRWKRDTTDTTTSFWSTKFCSSDYIKSSFAYSLVDVNRRPTILTYMSVIKDATILTSVGYPLNYNARENYKWIISFNETSYIKLTFTDVNLNEYKSNDEMTDLKDSLMFNEDARLYFNYEVDSNRLVIDNTFNGKIFSIETSVSYLTLTFLSSQQTGEFIHRGTGFRCAVIKQDIPSCSSLSGRFDVERRLEHCVKPSMYLSSLSYYNLPFTGKTVRWNIYRRRGFLRIDMIHFDITCNPETVFTINKKMYCNLDKPARVINTSASRDVTVILTTANPKDVFRLLITWYNNEEMPDSISSTAADIPAIYLSIESLAVLTGDRPLQRVLYKEENTDLIKNSIKQKWNMYKSDPNFPYLLYKACSEKFRKCYSIFSYHGSWNFAGGECWIRRQRLVAIRSVEELKLIKYLLKNFKFLFDNNTEIYETVSAVDSEFYYAYIGLRRIPRGTDRNAFLWENRAPATFSDWKNGEPLRGDCTRMGVYTENDDSTWETHDCSSNSAFYFVCEDVISNTSKEMTDRVYASQYTGNISVTKRGYTCQRWDSQYPHTHYQNMNEMFPEGSVTKASNFCRDPNRANSLWCYTTDPYVQWDTCDLNELKEDISASKYVGYLDTTVDGTKCAKWNCLSLYSIIYRNLWCYVDDEDSLVSLCSLRDTASDRCLYSRHRYYGTANVTASGKGCQRWKLFFSQDDWLADNDIEDAANYCRDPTSEGFQWCYITYPGKVWEVCIVEEMTDDCYRAYTSEYTGSISVTKRGYTCQRWDSQYPHTHYHNKNEMFPEGSTTKALNLCRDPKRANILWCNTTDPNVQWDTCDMDDLPDIVEGGLTPPEISFECNDGQVVNGYERCNGVINCDDLSDETDCVTKIHPMFQNFTLTDVENATIQADSGSLYNCTSQEVISILAVCDGVLDCRDASDEINCTQHDDGICSEDQFKCGDGNCIHISLFCNSVSDCIDSSDENCEHALCSSDEFKCDSGQCIQAARRCDAFPHCWDGSDENNCESCHKVAFHCDYIKCLPYGMQCDTYPDCEDGTDEMSCGFQNTLSCKLWWNYGFRHSGMYKMPLTVPGLGTDTINVTCNFDSIEYHNELYTLFPGVDIIEWKGQMIFASIQVGELIYDQVMDYYLFSGKKALCTQEVVQSCNQTIEDAASFDDPYHQHMYSYCVCIIATLLISDEPEIVSVRYCNNSEPVDTDDIDDVVLFNYIHTHTQRILEWKNVSVNFDSIQLMTGNASCKEEFHPHDREISCVEGYGVIDSSVRCLYDVFTSGVIKGCRSGDHLQNCDLPESECPANTVKCPGSYCIPLRYICDEVEQCPNAEDEIGCGCEDNEREVLIVYEEGALRGPNITKLVKQLHTPKSTIRSIVYSSSQLPRGIPYSHRLLTIKDKELKTMELIDRNYECEYKLLANDFLKYIKFTKKKKKSIIFVQSSPESKVVAQLMFGNITERPNITIYRVLESPPFSFQENISRFVIDVAVKNWNILSSLASRYLPEICKEAFTASRQGVYKCFSSKVSITVGKICDGVMDCIHGDDELLCRFTCPVRCICKGYAMNCKVYDLNKTSISTFSKFSRSLTFIRDNEAEITLAEDVLDFPYLYLLNLSSCNIENIEPNAFFNVANLRVLDLSNNRIITLFPLIFSGLQHLHTLILDGNSYLETLEAFTFQNLKSVKHLRIAGTKLKILVTNTFAGLNLQRLELENNNFQHIEKSGLGNLEVKYISFEFNSVTSFDKGMFTGVSSLNYLRTPAYKYCCIRPNYVAEDRCFPTKDEFSSCEDLMRNSVLQTLLWIIGLCSLFGNILSFLYRLKFDRERLKLGYGIFVTNLAVADFCMGMYLITIAVADAVFRKRYIFMDDYWRNSIWCTLAGVLSTLSSEASVMFLCLITLDRLLVIKYPFGQVRLNGKRAAVLSAVVWVLCSVIALFPLMYSAYFRSTFYNKSGVCIALPLTRDRPPGWLYSVLIFVVLNFVTFLLITAGQWSIFTNVRKSRKGLTKGSLARKRDLTVARNLLLVVATDFLCWFPIGCIGLMALSGHVISGDVYAWAAVFILPVNSALNPVLYTLTAILGKKNFTPRINEQANQAVRPDLGKYIIMRRYHVHDSGPENAYKSLGEILHDTSLPASIILKIAHQLTQTLQVLHKSSLMMGTVNENSLYIKVTENKIKGDVQLRQEPNLCKRRTDTCIDMHELGLLLRTLIRNSYCKTNKSG